MSHNGCANGGLALPNSLEVREVLVSDPSRLALLLLPLGLNVLVNGVRLRIEGLESGGSRIVRPTWPDVQSATPTFPTHPGPPALPILDPPGHGPAELSLSLSLLEGSHASLRCQGGDDETPRCLAGETTPRRRLGERIVHLKVRVLRLALRPVKDPPKGNTNAKG